MTKLAALQWHPCMVTQLGCVGGCLEYLGRSISRPWLYGGSGHAFIICLNDRVDATGATAWNPRLMLDLLPNLGGAVDGLRVRRAEASPGFRGRQRQAYDLVRDSLDAGWPCYAWDLEAPRFYLIEGYDEVGYYYKGHGCELGKGPLPWDRLGERRSQLLEIRRVQARQAASDARVARDAIEMALRHAVSPSEWVRAGYRSGPAAFDAWAASLDAGTASIDGHIYNARLWHECRAMAVAFLAELKERLPRLAAACDRAAGHYAVVRDRLAEVVALQPPRQNADWVSTFTSAEAAVLVRQAGAAEVRALTALSDIAQAL